MRKFDDPTVKCLFGHQMPSLRLHFHNAKCKERKAWLLQGKQIYHCPYHYSHEFLKEEELT